MGIKNLYKFIEKYASDAIKLTKITDYKNTTIGIDFNLMIYKLIYSLRKNGYDLINYSSSISSESVQENNNRIHQYNDKKIVTHIHTLLLKFIKFKKYNIIPVFVFDGKAPSIKFKELYKRKKSWEKLSQKYKHAATDAEKKKYFYTKADITEEEINDCKKLISIFGYPLIESIEEADGQLAQLSKTNLIQYIASDDMDILLFGGDILLKKFSVAENKKIQEINLENLKKILGFSQSDLIKLGVLLGSDYCDNSPISINKAYKIIKNIEENNIETQCEQAIKYFKKPVIKNIKKIDLKQINIEELKIYLKKFYFKDEYIDKIISKFN